LPGARHALLHETRLDLLAEHKGITLDLATIPAEDPKTYAMIRKADTLGTFQIESRAQMSMLPRIKHALFMISSSRSRSSGRGRSKATWCILISVAAKARRR